MYWVKWFAGDMCVCFRDSVEIFLCLVVRKPIISKKIYHTQKTPVQVFHSLLNMSSRKIETDAQNGLIHSLKDYQVQEFLKEFSRLYVSIWIVNAFENNNTLIEYAIPWTCTCLSKILSATLSATCGRLIKLCVTSERHSLVISH